MIYLIRILTLKITLINIIITDIDIEDYLKCYGLPLIINYLIGNEGKAK